MQTLLNAGHDANSCRSYAPLPRCRISEFLAAPFARNRRFRDFFFEVSHVWRMRERRAGWGVLRVRSEYSCRERLPKRNVVDPRGMPAVLFSGTGWDWGSLWFPPPERDPAVHSDGLTGLHCEWDGLTALHCAAIHGNLRIVRILIESNAAVGAQDFGG